MNRQFYSVNIDTIDAGDRLRPVDPDYVALLAASMAERGLDTPIVITAGGPDGNSRLIAGAHRLAAARSLGWEEIEAEIRDLSEDEAQLAEIDENLVRRELSALDRAVFLAKRKEIYERLHPEAKAGGDRRSIKATSLSLWSAAFARSTAEKLGVDKRTIERAVRRAALPAEIRERLATHPVANSGAELDKLLAQPIEMQRQIVGLLVGENERLPTVTAALQRLAGPVKESRAAATQREANALLAAWRKAGKAARRQFLDYLASEGEIAGQPQPQGRAA